MNIKEIKIGITAFLKKVPGKMKETLGLPFAKTYIIASIFLTLLFCVFMFPYGTLVRNRLMGLEKKYLSSIFVGTVDASLVDVTIIDSIHAVLKNKNELTLSDITANLSVNPYTLFYKKNIKADLQISRLIYKTEKADISLKLNGNFDLMMDKNYDIVENGTASVIIQNALLKIPEIKIPSPMGEFPISLPDVRISSINFKCSIEKGELKISRLKITGQDLKGEISGTIKIAKIFSNSILNLNVSIDPESKVLAEYKELLAGFTGQKGKITLPLKGTFARPRLDLKKDGSRKTGADRGPGIEKVKLNKRDPIRGKIPSEKKVSDEDEIKSRGIYRRR